MMLGQWVEPYTMAISRRLVMKYSLNKTMLLATSNTLNCFIEGYGVNSSTDENCCYFGAITISGI
jgi:hypothetical protein